MRESFFKQTQILNIEVLLNINNFFDYFQKEEFFLFHFCFAREDIDFRWEHKLYMQMKHEIDERIQKNC